MKKHGLVGSPISSIFLECFAKKSVGGISLMAAASPTLDMASFSSGRCNCIVAAKLDKSKTRMRVDNNIRRIVITFRFVCPTNKEL